MKKEKIEKLFNDIDTNIPSGKVRKRIIKRHGSVRAGVENLMVRVNSGEVNEILLRLIQEILVPPGWEMDEVLELLFGFTPDPESFSPGYGRKAYRFFSPSGDVWELWVDENNKNALVNASVLIKEKGFEADDWFSSVTTGNKVSGFETRKCRSVSGYFYTPFEQEKITTSFFEIIKGIFLMMLGGGFWYAFVQGVELLCGKIVSPAICEEIGIKGLVAFLILSCHLVLLLSSNNRSRLLVYPTIIMNNGFKLLVRGEYSDGLMGLLKKITSFVVEDVIFGGIKNHIVGGIIALAVGVAGWWLYYTIGSYIAAWIFASNLAGNIAGVGFIVVLHVVAIIISSRVLGRGNCGHNAGLAAIAVVGGSTIMLIWPTVAIWVGLIRIFSIFRSGSTKKEKRKKS